VTPDRSPPTTTLVGLGQSPVRYDARKRREWRASGAGKFIHVWHTVLNVPVKRSPQLPAPKQLPQTHSIEQRRPPFGGSALFRTLRTYLELALNLGRRFICFSTMGHKMPTTMKAHVKALPPR
jgi:hypothetical protein